MYVLFALLLTSFRNATHFHVQTFIIILHLFRSTKTVSFTWEGSFVINATEAQEEDFLPHNYFHII